MKNFGYNILLGILTALACLPLGVLYVFADVLY